MDFEAILDKAGLNGALVTPIGTGLYNDSFYIDAVEDRYVLRIAPADEVSKLFYEVDMMRSEPHIHQLVSGNSSVPVPEIRQTDFSREIIERDYLIMEFLPGVPGPFNEEELGGYIRQMHAIKGEAFGYPDRAAPQGEAWPELFADYARLILKDCLDCGILEADEHGWFMDIYTQNLTAVKACDPCLLHLDLWTQNILTENGRITALLDFDRGLYGDPELEFAVLDTYGSSTPSFFKGYGKPRADGPEAAVRQVLYLVYEMIKYAFIRHARGGSYGTGRHHVEQCQRLLKQLE